MKHKFSELKTQTKGFIKGFSQAISDGEITQHSIVIAYYVLFSIFPIIIIIGNVLPLFKIATKPIADYLSVIFPVQVSEFLMPMINSLLSKHSGGILSFGIIVAIWSFSGLINSIRIAMNKVYGVHLQEKHEPWWNAVVSRILTFAASALMIFLWTLLTLVLTFGQQIVSFLAPIFQLHLEWIYKFESYKWPLIILMMLIVNIYLNYFLPNINGVKRVVVPGAIFTTIGWSALSYFFGLYLKYFGTKWQNYGIVGTFIVFMLWMNISALIFLIGVCINASLNVIKHGEVQYTKSSVLSALRQSSKK
ncbi:membrane protein [Lactobacillus colini]|uniref:Membrane protein n=1 Tax=Lactobacillus colini TaxID=1819254 RepID=A0ABS4MD33_9LACO|nr:YihY/virulence factor BrkB family protein [Lactobacillus colini]MBP2057593.1 membrane protein [Lactobacillus colini]